MKLEEGMYVRTKQGIGKIKNHEHYWVNNEEWNYITTDIGLDFDIDLILKASHNIIDLIEVGDYVNGYKVSFIENDERLLLAGVKDYQRVFCEEYEKDLYNKAFKLREIKTIVTKQQFESMQYEVK